MTLVIPRTGECPALAYGDGWAIRRDQPRYSGLVYNGTRKLVLRNRADAERVAAFHSACALPGESFSAEAYWDE